jgi:NADPH:quinone reductase-like Zn-dependent oxidoreductase
VVVLKRLADAERDGDPVLAVIRGSAVNQDGASAGLTAPNQGAQESLIEAALRDAGVLPSEVSYLECHGTGTALGDPIEVQAAARALGPGRPPERPLLLGSVKASVGHLEAAAGVAGLIKVVLALGKGLVPGQLHYRRPNPHIDWAGLPARVAERAGPWPVGRRLAGVSSFGFSGTNAHVVVEAPPEQPAPAAAPAPPCHLLALSAKSAEALRELAGRYAEWLAAHPDADLADVCYTAGAGRGHFGHRAAVVARSPEEARELSARLAAGESSRGLMAGEARGRPPGDDTAGAATALAAALAGRWPVEVPPGLPRSPGEALVGALGERYVRGLNPDFEAPGAPCNRRKMPLPTYPFQRERYWAETARRRPPLNGQQEHPLLGVRQRLAGSNERRFEQLLAADSPAWLNDHRVFDRVLFPGAGFIEMAQAAAGGEVCELSIDAPLVLDRPALVQAVVREDGALEVFAQPQGQAAWRRHVTGRCGDGGTADTAALDPQDLRRRCRQRLDAALVYDQLAAAGLNYGPHFRTVRELHLGDGEVLARLHVADGLPDAGEYALPPTLLDGAFQALAVLASDSQATYLPVGVAGVRSHRALGEELLAYGRWERAGRPGDDLLVGELTLCDEQGLVLAEVRGLRLRRASPRALAQVLSGGGTDDLLYRIDWRKQPHPLPAGTPAPAGVWLVLGETAGAVALVADQLRAQGQEVRPGRAQDVAELQGPELAGVALLGEAGPGDAAQAAARLAQAGLHVAQALLASQARPPHGLVLLTSRAVAVEAGEEVDPAQAVLWGLGRSAHTEQPHLGVRLIDVDRLDMAALGGVLLSHTEPQLAIRGGEAFIPGLARIEEALPAEEAALSIHQRGSMDGLRLVPCEVPTPPRGAVQVAVRAAGLNFRDVLSALGAYPGDPGPPGGELAGVITAVGEGVSDLATGDRVFGLATGAFAARCNVPAELLARMPPGLGFAEAATAPVAFCTAQAAFALAGLRCGQRVLIHAAAGGVGLAAVQLAQALGAEVFATASAGKWEYLRGLGLRRIYESRGTGFGARVLADTDSAGVDVVLNSLTAEGFIEASLSCLGRGGRFVEIAKRDVWSPERVRQARPDVDYHVLALDAWVAQQPGRVGALLRQIAGRLGSGELRPLRRRLHPLAEAAAAFRHMQQARHTGKIVLTVGRAAVRPGAAYLVTGGLGALGLAACEWLAGRGAAAVVLAGRRAPDEAARRRLAALRRSQGGCAIHTHAADVAEADQAADLVGRFGRDWPPLAGVIHAAGVVDDGVLTEQTAERLEQVLRPKVRGAWNLHRATAGLDLDFFVLYSSAAAVLGTAGQAGYAAANAFLDGLARHRQALGLPAMSVNWGPWAGAGMAAGEAARAHLARQGLRPLPAERAHDALGRLLAGGVAGAVVLDADCGRLGDPLRGPAPAAAGALPAGLRELPEPERAAVLVRHLQGELRQVLGLSGPPDPQARFFEIGMDSLTAVELRNRLQRQLGPGHPLANTLAFDFPTPARLADHLAGLMGGLKKQIRHDEARNGRSAGPTKRPDVADESGLIARLTELLDREI